ncbi:MAG: peroxidase-related enzyme [Acidimicrobiia bacterium]|nr:peroxidase-related enzyme [Acidimicrobiia bacterium]
MAYIRQIERADATGDLKVFYDALFEIVGDIPNIVKLSSLKVAAASAAQDLYQSVLYHDSGLSMEEKEMVATVVSVINGCVYCHDHHGGVLTRLTDDPDLVDQIISNFRDAPISSRAMCLLEFAEKLTRTSGSMGSADIEALRDLGLSDEDILDLVQLVSYFNYTNRVAVALGVDPEISDT